MEKSLLSMVDYTQVDYMMYHYILSDPDMYMSQVMNRNHVQHHTIIHHELTHYHYHKHGDQYVHWSISHSYMWVQSILLHMCKCPATYNYHVYHMSYDR